MATPNKIYELQENHNCLLNYFICLNSLKLVERRKSNVLNLNTHFAALLCRHTQQNHSSNTPTPHYAPDERYLYYTLSLGKWAYSWNAIYIK